MTSSSGIVSFVHCRDCTIAGSPSRLEVGLVDQKTLRVWCKTCDHKLADLPLAQPMALRCDICGGPITKGHKH